MLGIALLCSRTIVNALILLIVVYTFLLVVIADVFSLPPLFSTAHVFIECCSLYYFVAVCILTVFMSVYTFPDKSSLGKPINCIFYNTSMLVHRVFIILYVTDYMHTMYT